MFTFTDTLIEQVSTIRAIHITELRTALTAVYVAAGQAPPVFTDPTIIPGVTPLKAVHILELRAAVVSLP